MNTLKRALFSPAFGAGVLPALIVWLVSIAGYVQVFG